MAFPPETAERLIKLLLVAISNNQDNESLNALRALRRALTNENISAHDLVQNLTAPPGYSEEQAMEIYRQGGDDREQQLRANMPAPVNSRVQHTPSKSSRWHEGAVLSRSHQLCRPAPSPVHQQYFPANPAIELRTERSSTNLA
jgi:hypothetical protein